MNREYRIEDLTEEEAAYIGAAINEIVPHEVDADEEGRFAAGLIAEAEKGACAYIDALFVEEPLRRQGLGTYFLREAEKVAKENGASMILTTAGDWNVEFFKKNGYLLRGELKDVPKGHDCYELYKNI